MWRVETLQYIASTLEDSVSHRYTRQLAICVILFMLIFNVKMLNVSYLLEIENIN